ncbi:MAG TPA: transposase [Thermoanaerobaculia bacterium]|jgi:REP element-mobilizing transposase RayT|nr:transposase [Thermoanaerobaculia bacterium]
MSRPLRLEYPGALFHVTHRGNEKRRIFFDDRDRRHFLELLGDTVRRFGWIVTAYALMPNHYHAVIELTDTTLSRGMQWLNGAYARWVNRRHDRVGHLFQGRFKSFLIEKESYFLEVQRYVVLNPVRAKIVERPDDYEWSSYRATIGHCERPSWLAADNVLLEFGPGRILARARYERFVDEGLTSSRRPWDDLVGQIYLGHESWINEVKDRLEIKPRQNEHPRSQRVLARPDMARILSAIALAMGVDETRIRRGRGGVPRMIAAWIGRYEGLLTNIEIAAALRLSSDAHVPKLVRKCDRELTTDRSLRDCIDRSLDTLGRKKDERQT